MLILPNKHQSINPLVDSGAGGFVPFKFRTVEVSSLEVSSQEVSSYIYVYIAGIKTCLTITDYWLQ